MPAINDDYYCYPDCTEFQTQTYRGICITDISEKFQLEPVIKRFYTAGNVPQWSELRRAKAHEAFAVDWLMYENWRTIKGIHPSSGSAFDNFCSDSYTCEHNGTYETNGDLVRSSHDDKTCDCKSTSDHKEALEAAFALTDDGKTFQATFERLNASDDVTEEECRQFNVDRATAFNTFLETVAAAL